MSVIVNGSVEVIQVSEDSYRLVTSPTDYDVIVAGVVGPQGPPGPGGSGATYIFNQGSPTTTWTINHNLNKYPSITVVDSGGTTVVGSYTYNNANTIVLTFTVAFGGRAYLN